MVKVPMRRCLRHSSQLADILYSHCVYSQEIGEHPRRRYVNLSLTCVDSTNHGEDTVQ